MQPKFKAVYVVHEVLQTGGICKGDNDVVDLRSMSEADVYGVVGIALFGCLGCLLSRHSNNSYFEIKVNL